ncbi:uncharacterized protein LOC143363293 [Halictus rubicundus]|uniref:uncharacterized protein LOC143363293 n=1 Tax=Halictus rubicundus TaxID=77578 RepID=UPI004035E74D
MPTNSSQTTNDLAISDLDQQFDLQMINNRNDINYSIFREIKETLTIRLIFNIDGVPVSKNSNKQFWPILPYIMVMYRSNTFSLLSALVSLICVICFTCDAPARAFLKNIKGHTGRNSCERCTEEGTYYKKRIIYENHNASARTHEDFKNFRDIKHHKNNERTPLLNISTLNIIEDFALDYMHLCCLGVMKKLLHHWCKVEFRLQQRNKLSKRMISAAKYLPSEFNRKSRSISELPRYKATEFRLFLLYLGPILLKKILPNIFYNHFLLLHAAMRILLLNKLRVDVKWLNKAREMLIQFVNDSSVLYGREFSVYNVHNLVHITDDVQNLKYSLEELSCFPFENYLGKLISMLRRWNKPLAQTIKRLSENGAPTIKETSKKSMCRI